MDPFETIELLDCPLCHGAGMLQDEDGWCVYVACLDCGCHTAELRYRSPEERMEMARQAARFWSVGKVIHPGPGE